MARNAWSMLCLMVLLFVSIRLTGQEAENSKFADVDVHKAREMIAANSGNDKFVLLDTRMPAEYDKGHLDGAVFMNYHAPEFMEQINSLTKGKIYLVYCHSGERSGKTVKFMKELGFNEAHNMQGGILAWKKAGYPVLKGEKVTN